MFTVGSMELFKRLTLIAEDGRIKKVFYPVFPPDRNADDVLAYLRSDAQPGAAGDAPKAARP
jgi:peroxiredoxin